MIKKIFICMIFMIYIPHLAYAFNPYSTEELEQLEKEFIQLINQSGSIERDPLAIQYINHLGRELTHVAHIRNAFFFIVKSNEINAFAGPGGYIGINSQLILTTSNENELASVMAHEISHVKLHHLYRTIQHEKQMRVPMLASLLASIALSAIDPTLASGAVLASLTGFTQDSINFIRANEKAADRIGINILNQSGFNPRGMIAFFKKMQTNSRYYYTTNVPAILRTHPLDEERIAEAENSCALFKRKQFADNIDYHLFKELIRNSVKSNNKQLLDFYKSECVNQNTQEACAYGNALALSSINRSQSAINILRQLIAHDKDNLFYQIAMADAEFNNHEHASARIRLQELQANYPDSYATLMAYARILVASGKSQTATTVLLKGFRKFKHDLPLCEALAMAQSKARQKVYAYFTQSQCYLLQGRKREALAQLEQAKHFDKKNSYLNARINAMVEMIKEL